ncbi:5-formyltetrahydrofolate cyclo-ligase [Pontiella agarivorans]|uniref:5-formyltetrahydrofolate cyclo-ligase n=1 Tax=Pontiella agarivorans TaxID=3038953 RepID=A0ABU5N1Y2_9BACT|nr:5-formyltetrahydrofolate cyclo-ligase [Pontiella agarivorans]MDZ8120376.1 5-formyltetrahydrofolate cyclo-ligase [Pontiella agarivorans]
MTLTKQKIRKTIATKRTVLDPQWLEKTSTRIVENLQSLEEFQSSETVALYKAIGGEVNLELLFEICWSLGKRTAIPVFNPETRIYEMAEITASTAFEIGNYGIQEPVSPCLLPLSDIDLIAVPGVAFDPSGNRLGRGGGYYDRMLSGFPGITTGICFDFQYVETVPVDLHDRPVDHIVSETKCRKVPKER